MQAFRIELPRQARLAAMTFMLAGVATFPLSGLAQKTAEQNAAKSSLHADAGLKECTSITATGAWKARAVSNAETERCRS